MGIMPFPVVVKNIASSGGKITYPKNVYADSASEQIGSGGIRVTMEG